MDSNRTASDCEHRQANVRATDWRAAPQHLRVHSGEVHVWRIPLDTSHELVSPMLSHAEQHRADTFRDAAHRDAYIRAHSALRTILSAYLGGAPAHLEFIEGAFGKPSLAPPNADQLEFNLAHSGDFAILAVTADRAVGVDIIRWDGSIDHSGVAARMFSVRELEALHSIDASPARMMEGFYAAWSRKEAYVKATGRGLAGTQDFDVSLIPGEPASLIADRADTAASSRWSMISLPVPAGYSAALVCAELTADISLFDAAISGATFQADHASANPNSTSAT